MPEPDPIRTTPWADQPIDAEPLEAALPGTDRYELGAEIARGGMGVVVRAHDHNLNRELAVKLVHGHLCDHPAILRRFQEEAETLGRLQHPGIVPVHEVGTLPDGRPFFAMKLVAGRTLADLLKHRPTDDLQLGRFLPVFEQICQTVAFAHSKGFIHRDLKPANVMVGEFGEVQVMDWGIARELANPERERRGNPANPDRNGKGEPPANGHVSGSPAEATTAHVDPSTGNDLTTAGQVVGTPAYMPPEQARGELDRVGFPADVFALGGILCEILTRKPPYTGAIDRVMPQAQAGDIAPAVARLEASGADPELIALAVRCLNPDPTRRPNDAGAVAKLVADYQTTVRERLERATVAAAEARVQVAEQRKRRKVQFALAVTVLALTVGGVAVGMWYRTTRLVREAELAAEREAVGRVVEDATEQTYRDLAAGRWSDARTSLARADDRLANGDWPAEFTAKVAQTRADLDVAFALERARMEEAAFDRRTNTFETVKAVAAYRAAFTRANVPVWELPAEEAANRIRASRIAPILTTALDRWAWVEPELTERLRGIADLADSDPWRRKLRARIARAGLGDTEGLETDPGLLDQPASALDLLARLYPPKEGTALLRRAQLRHPDEFWLNHSLGLLLKLNPRESAIAASRPGDITTPLSREVYLEAVGYLRAAVALRPQDPGAWVNLGSALYNAGDLPGAIAAARRAIELEPNYPAAFNNLALYLHSTGDLDGAEAAARRAVALDADYPHAHFTLGSVFQSRRDLDAAAEQYHRVIALNPRSVFGDPLLGLTYQNLALVHRDKNDLGAAIAAFRKSLEHEPNAFMTHHGLGTMLHRKGESAAAVPHFRRATELQPKFHPSFVGLGIVLEATKDYEGAAAAFRSALALDPRAADAHFNLGNVLRAQKDWEAALACYQQVLRLDPNMASVAWVGVGLCLEALGERERADKAFKEAARMEPKRFGSLANRIKPLAPPPREATRP